jgi:hypothetical protein
LPCNGNEAEPIKSAFADERHAKFLKRETRQASKPAPTKEVRQALQTTYTCKRRQPDIAQATHPAPVPRNLRGRRYDNTSVPEKLATTFEN